MHLSTCGTCFFAIQAVNWISRLDRSDLMHWNAPSPIMWGTIPHLVAYSVLILSIAFMKWSASLWRIGIVMWRPTWELLLTRNVIPLTWNTSTYSVINLNFSTTSFGRSISSSSQIIFFFLLYCFFFEYQFRRSKNLFCIVYIFPSQDIISYCVIFNFIQ